MYGWRARVGLLLPSTDTTTEPEFNRLAPDGVTFHAARMLLSSVTMEGLIEMEKQSVRAAREVASAGVDLICFCCTTGTLVKGPGFDAAIQNEIEAITGIPVQTTARAVVQGLRSLGVTRVAVATPYNDDLNRKEKEFLESEGMVVTRIRGLGMEKLAPRYPLAKSKVSPIGLLEPYVAYKLAKDVDCPEADGIFISCTGLRTIEIIDALEKDLGKPVTSSNQAMFAAILKKLQIGETIEGYGSLLRAPR
jgi:maleate isomerase